MITLKKQHKRHKTYKDSGIEWIGKIPIEWDARRIKMLSQIRRGASPRPIDNPKYFNEDGEYAWVRIADVTASNMYLEKTTQRLSKLGKSLSVPLEPGALFLSIAGSVGKPIITNIKCCIHDGFVYFKNLNYSSKLIYYIFLAGEAYQGLGKLGTQLNLNTETVGNIFVPYQSDNEQKSLTKYLDFKTPHIESIIKRKKLQIRLLKAKKKAIITKAVTQGLDEGVEMKNSGVEWIGKIPKSWSTRKLKYCSKKTFQYGANEAALDEDREQPRFVRITDVGENGNLREETFKSLDYAIAKNFLLESGDILFARSGATVGKTFQYKTSWGRCCFAGYLIKFSPFPKLLLSDFMNYIVNSRYYLDWKGSIFIQSTIQNISAEKYKNFVIALPPLQEQKKIIEYLDSETKKIDETMQKIEQSIQLLHEYKISLISNVVTGKIKITN